jgi:GT2 family glycosyltransferase
MRHHLKATLIEAYGAMGVIWHPIVFQDESADFNEPWIYPYIIPMDRKDCIRPMPQYTMRNYWIQNNEIIDEDYYVTVDDDDMYEAGVFDEIKKMDDDIVIISMKRGCLIPDEAIEIRRYPTYILYARPESIALGEISSQQSFVKGKIFKQHLFDDSDQFGDGSMAVHHKEDGEQIAYRPDLFALFNYFEPGRWKERQKMVSIVIPVYNQHEMTEECIEAIRRNTDSGTYEIIIIDNGSDPALDIPHLGQHIMQDKNNPKGWHIGESIIRNEQNLGFPFAVNQGIIEAKGDTIILLNNDVIVTPGWAERLRHYLDNGWGIIGPVTNYCAGLQRVILPVYENEKELNTEAAKWSEAHKGETEEVTFIIGFCMAFKKSLFDEIGLFDATLWPCSGEEIDFCFRARKAGYKVGFTKDVYLHHFGSVTFKEMHDAGQVDYPETCKRNDEHLAERWGHDFWKRQVVAA